MRSRSVLSALAVAVVLWCVPGGPAWSQAVTTGTIVGTVTAHEDGSVLPGVTVTAIHQPTGTHYTAVTRGDGSYSIFNVRVGGPYRVTAMLSGFREAAAEDIQIALGESRSVALALEFETVAESIVVTAEAPLIDTANAGAATNVSEEQIAAVPTINRSIEDIAKTSLYFVSSGNVSGDAEDTISVAGRNNRYNTVQIDGAVNNDLFGLSPTGSPNGQADAQPISMEAIQEVQLLVSPYDVRQGGFSGGGINAITKSGSNAWHGSVYMAQRDEGLVGDGRDDRPFEAFSEDRYALSLGGPVIQDKVFFFVAAEMVRKDTPTGFSAASIGVQPEAQRFVDILRNGYGYDPGSIGEFVRRTDNDNYFLRLDANIGTSSQLTFRHNIVDAVNDIWSGGSTFFITSDRPYNIRPETNSTVVQWNSVLGADYYNEARVGYTTVETVRDGPTRFPTVQVDLPNGVSLEAGRERFSTANVLDQDILEINDDLTFVRGSHTLTVGTHNELFSFYNLFIRDFFGFYNFRSLDDLERGWADQFEHSYSLTSNPQQASEFDARQYGLYAGDQWQVKPNLSVSYGLRADLLQLPDAPSYNPQVDAIYGLRTDKLPDSNLVISPRIGFNWDPTETGRQQVRGGLGIFSGRTPYVWISNQYGATGMEFQRLRATLSPPITEDNHLQFFPNPDGQPKTVGGTVTNEIALTDPDFEMPTILRGNLAYDFELTDDIVATAEVTYQAIQKDIQYQNLNLRRTGETGVGGRPVYERISGAYTGVYYLTNTSDGDGITAALDLRQRPQDGFYWSAGYIYQDADEVYPGTSSQASSNYINVSVLDPENPGTAPATFATEHRIVASTAYRMDWGPVGSTFSLYFNRQSGRPYSMTFGSSDANGDGVFGNDLVYVPGSPDEVILVDGSGNPVAWEDFDAYISADSSLAGARGGNVGRNAGTGPWNTRLDFRWALDIPVSRVNVQVTADLINLLNFIDSDRGIQRFVLFGEVSPWRYDGVDADTGKLKYTVFTTDPDRRFFVDDVRSRWQARLGVRVSF